MKRIICLMMSMCISFGIIGYSYAQNENNVTVFVGGAKLETKAGDPPAMIVGNRTMMPFTAFLEAIGCEIGWDASTMTATAKKDGTEILVTINSNIAYVNGASNTLEVAPQIIKDRTMIPISFIALELGYEVSWDANSYTAYIGSKTANTAPEKDNGEKNTEITGTFALQNLQRQNFVVQFNSNMSVDILNISTNTSGVGTFTISGNDVVINTNVLSGSFTMETITNEGVEYLMLTSSDGSNILALKSISYETFANGYTSSF